MKDLYKSILDGLYDGVYFVDRKRKITFWNKAAEELTGYTAKELEGRFCFDNILDHIDLNNNHLCFSGCPLHATMQDGVQREAAVYLKHKGGHRMPVVVKTIPMYEDGEIIGAIEIFNDNFDVFNSFLKLEEFKDMAFTDQLTGLPNRHYIQEFFDTSASLKKIKTSAMFVDIDDFKHINDTYGHDFGDIVLKEVSKVLRGNIKKSDEVFRYGGEEFVAFIFDNHIENAIGVAERIREMVSKLEIDHEGETIKVTISGGVAMQEKGEQLEDTIRRADELMYKAKRTGKNKIIG